MLRRMCCFSRAVAFVGKTQIFARHLDEGMQALVYAMQIETHEETAMVLPLPVPPSTDEGAVTFIDLSLYPQFFADLGNAFPSSFLGFAPQARGAPRAESQLLRVVEVGSFVASFVPTPSDFARLDPRFRLPPSFFRALPRYEDHGFAVFCLKPGASRREIHPMALRFPRRDPSALFFPTVHMHDGTVPAEAHFDHTLTCQPSPLLARLLTSPVPIGWAGSSGPLGSFVDGKRDGGITAPDAHAFRLTMFGSQPNDDTWLREPAGLTLADLSHTDSVFAWELRALHGFAGDLPNEPQRTWQHTSRTKLVPLARALTPVLRDLVERLGKQIRFAPFSVATRPHFLNGNQLWSGNSYLDGSPIVSRGPGFVLFAPFTQKVEPQKVWLGFAELPGPAEIAFIQRELSAALDRALS